MPNFINNKPMSRRTLLRGLGVGLALPLLDAMVPAVARAGTLAEVDVNNPPRRMLGICNNLGLLPDQFFPQNAGRDYTLSPYLQLLERHRSDFTVFSGVWHPDVDGGHPADICFLTAAHTPAAVDFAIRFRWTNSFLNVSAT